MTAMSPGAKFRAAMKAEKPLQCVGAINAYHARLAQATGFKSIYLSGGGVAAGSLGLPDLGISNLDDVLTDIERITNVCDLPLLVDVDTGFGSSAFNIARTTKSLIKCGRRRDAHRGPGRRQALRPPPGQGTGEPGRDGRPREGRGRRQDRPRLRHHGAHRRARRTRACRPRSIAHALASKPART